MIRFCSALLLLFLSTSVQAEHIIGHQSLQLPGNSQLPPVIEPNFCESTKFNQVIATDGSVISFRDTGISQNQRVLIRGYRYEDSVPTGSIPEGEGRVMMYCGCERVQLATSAIGDRQDPEFPVLELPKDLPSGDYSFEVLDVSGSCEAGVIGTACAEPQICLRPSISLAPAHILITSDQLTVDDNSETPAHNPAELTFAIAAESGVKPGQDNVISQFTGAFPAGHGKYSHLTNDDGSDLNVSIPLFSAAEQRLTLLECREECHASGGVNDIQACLAICDDQTYTDQIEIGVSGIEKDSSPDMGWTKIIEIGAEAIECKKKPDKCDGEQKLGKAIGKLIKDLAGDDDDDKIGAVEKIFQSDVNDWDIGRKNDRRSFDGADSGIMSLALNSNRVPAPHVLSYSVKIKTIELLEGYELEVNPFGQRCIGKNEIVLQAQAFLGNTEKMRAPESFFAQSPKLEMNPGETVTINRVIDSRQESHPSEALEAPYIFLSVGLWEDDGVFQPDLLGYEAETIVLADLINANTPPDLSFTTSNHRKGHLKHEGSFFLNGYDGSDRDCLSPTAAVPPFTGEKGRATVTYEIELEWLVHPEH